MRAYKCFSIPSVALLLLACGGGNGTSDNTPPNLILPDNITVLETSSAGAIVTYVVHATDDSDPFPDINCTPESGSLFKRGSTTVYCTATDSSNNQSQGSFLVTVTSQCGTTTNSNILIEGNFTFDRVPHKADEPGLDYTKITRLPARRITVNALDAYNSIIFSTKTDDLGNYSLQVPDSTLITIAFHAEMKKMTSPPYWDFHVRDNNNLSAQYAAFGQDFCSGTSNQTRNYFVSSGWDGSGYSGARVAAPFAILDTIYESVKMITDIDSSLEFPPLDIYWSETNASAYYNKNAIYLRGQENVNTDEYDSYVIAHELFHYITDVFSRSDSPGGSHYIGDHLDMRMAFSEGLSHALAAINLHDPLLRDSGGYMQQHGFSFNIEEYVPSSPGWFNELSTGKIIYDLLDSNNEVDDNDNLTLDFEQVWEVLVGDVRNQIVFSSIYKFISALKTHNPDDSAAIDNLTESQNIHVFSAYGDLETNNAGLNDNSILPIFHRLSTYLYPNVCVTNYFARTTMESNHNVLGMRHFVTFSPTVAGFYELEILGSGDSNPYLIAHSEEGVQVIDYSDGNMESLYATVNQREYMLEIIDDYTLTNSSINSTQCFDVRVEFIR